MKSFKITDLTVQVLILLGGFAWYFIRKNYGDDFIWLYFSVGGWQVLSLITHAFIDDACVNRKARRSYGKTILWTLIIGIVCWLAMALAVPVMLFYLGALLVISPIFAAWYFIIGIGELNSIKKKELIHLK